MKNVHIVAFFSVFAVYGEGISSANLSPIVTTKTGPVQGMVIHDAQAKQDVYQFTGIPFAEPPIGQHRFRKSVPKTPWKSVLQATTQPKACFGAFAPSEKESEDCLYLNIWVPSSTLDSASVAGSTIKQLPVYVFIHGGGFIKGNSLRLNGTTFSGINNVIFASIQYRLASFGFAYFGDNKDAPGNSGLWDQLEAMKWISQNIGSFGGNNSEITIGGLSAGAASVSFHLLSPYSRKYFQRAIIESGTALSSWALRTPEVAIKITDDVLRAAALEKCVPSINVHSSVTDKLLCLRSLEGTDICQADAASRTTGLSFSHVPVIDGDFIPNDPAQMLATGELYKVPLLIGATRDEGSRFIQLIPSLESILNTVIDAKGSASDYNDAFINKLVELGLNGIAGWAFPKSVEPTVVTAVQRHYWPNYRGHLHNATEVITGVIQMVGDYAFTCPVYNWASLAAATAPELPLYVYHFSQRRAGSPSPEWMGVIHGEELAYVLANQNLDNSNNDKPLARIVMEYWGNFVRYGNPNPREFPSTIMSRNWPIYVGKSCKQQIVELNAATQVLHYGDPVKCGVKALNCMFWAEIFPRLLLDSSLKAKYSGKTTTYFSISNVAPRASAKGGHRQERWFVELIWKTYAAIIVITFIFKNVRKFRLRRILCPFFRRFL